MKRIILIIIIALTLGSCASVKRYDLVKNYPDEYSFNINKSYNCSWNKLIDYIAENNINIHTIDKQSGLLIFDLYIERPFISTESGLDTNKIAYVVSPYLESPDYIEYKYPFNLNIRIYLRLYEEENSKSKLKIYIHNMCKDNIGYYLCGKSTGVLEQSIYDYINN